MAAMAGVKVAISRKLVMMNRPKKPAASPASAVISGSPIATDGTKRDHQYESGSNQCYTRLASWLLNLALLDDGSALLDAERIGCCSVYSRYIRLDILEGTSAAVVSNCTVA